MRPGGTYVGPLASPRSSSVGWRAAGRNRREGAEGGKRGGDPGTAELLPGLTIQEKGAGTETGWQGISCIFNMGDTRTCLHADGEEVMKQDGRNGDESWGIPRTDGVAGLVAGLGRSCSHLMYFSKIVEGKR